MSSGSPKRPLPMRLTMASRWASGSASVISVAMNPGATALAVMLRRASSRASDFVSPMTPALEAA